MAKLMDISNKITISYEQWGNVYSEDTNETLFALMEDGVTAEKLQSKSIGKLGTIFMYTLKVVNADDEPMTNLIFNELIAPELDYIAGTYEIDGVTQPDPQWNTWIELPDVPANTEMVVTFRVKVARLPD